MEWNSNIKNRKVQYATLLLLIAFVLLIRFSASKAISAPDTGGYVLLAETIEQGTFEEYSFDRTPGLPMLLLLVRYNRLILVTVQYILALLSILMFYAIASSYTSKFYLSLLCTSLYVLNFNIWSLSSSILTDQACPI